jgi:succinate dehydrogenase flavin-adding protein (antitoxin of CptAB toxin-antitoxin module)
MGKIESIEEQMKALSPEELERFRAWLQELDWTLWDEQLERGVASGKIDALAEKALRAGKSKLL